MIVFRFSFFLFMLFFSCFATPLTAAEPRARDSAGLPPPEKIHVLFDRYPGVQIIGFLAAKYEGLYRKAGVPEVVFHWSQSDEWSVPQFKSGEFHFTVGVLPQACYDVSRGKQLVVLSQMLRRSAYGLLYRTDCMHKVEKPADFNNRRIGVFYNEQQLMSAYCGYYKTKYRAYPILGSGLNLLIPGGLDAIGIRSYELPAYMEFARYRKVNEFISFADGGCCMPEDCLLCTTDFLDKHPDLCRNFVEATWRGWAFALQNPEKSLEILRNYFKLNRLRFEKQVVAAQFDAFQKTVAAESTLGETGMLTEKEYADMIQCMIQAGLLTEANAPSYSSLFRLVRIGHIMKSVDFSRYLNTVTPRPGTLHSSENMTREEKR